MKKFSRLAAVLLVLTMLLSMAGCGASDGKTHLSFQIWDTNQRAGMQAMCDAYTAKHPDVVIDVQVVSWGEYWTKLEAAAESNTMPDIFWMHTNQLLYYADFGVLADVTDLYDDVESGYYQNHFSDISLGNVSGSNGRYYGVPKDKDNGVLVYNKEMFDAAGVAYPDENWTWDDLVDASQKIYDATGNYGYLAHLDDQLGYWSYVYQNGGYILTADKTTAGFNQPGGKEAMEFYIGIQQKEWCPDQNFFTQNGAGSTFWSERGAMFMEGSWSLLSAMEDYPELHGPGLFAQSQRGGERPHVFARYVSPRIFHLRRGRLPHALRRVRAAQRQPLGGPALCARRGAEGQICARKPARVLRQRGGVGNALDHSAGRRRRGGGGAALRRFGKYDLITRAVRVKNTGSETVRLCQCASLCLDFVHSDLDLITFNGAHTMERCPSRVPVHSGIQGVDSVRGASSHQHNPFVVLCGHDTDEEHGPCSLTEVWSAALPAGRQGEVYHRYVLGVYEFAERLRRDFPHILIEGCCGGGGRFDGGMLYYTPQIWCSDNSDAIERVHIQYGTSFCYPVSTMGAHVSAVPNGANGRVTPMKTRGIVAMHGTFGYEMDLAKCTPEEKETIRRQVAEYKKYYWLIQDGDYYRLNDPFANGPYTAWEHVSADRRQALVSLVTGPSRAASPFLTVHLKGLDPALRYRINGEGSCLGAALMRVGWPLPLIWGDYQSFQLYLEAE